MKFQLDKSHHHIEIELNPKQSDECGHSFSSVRFYVLFNSLFRVLFNFPLRYLYSIGILVKYLALEGIHLPSSVCILKQTYSLETSAHLFSTYACRSGLSPTMSVCRTETLFRGLSGHTHIEGRPVPSPQLEPGVNQADSA